MAFTERAYQEKKANELVRILKEKRVAYLCAEPRVGKTFMAFIAASKLGAARILFLTPPKAQGSVRRDAAAFFGPDHRVEVTSLQSVHKAARSGWDLVVLDEAHKLAAFSGKPNAVQAAVKRFLLDADPAFVLLASATPTAEGPLRIFRQFWVVPAHPWSGRKFWSWVYEFVDFRMETIYRAGKPVQVPDFSRVRQERLDIMAAPFFVTCTQLEAGFRQDLVEREIWVDLAPTTYHALERLEGKGVVAVDGEEVKVETPMGRLQKAHQMTGGTFIPAEQVPGIIIDRAKAEALLKAFPDQRVGVFYRYQAEGRLLREVLTDWTDSPEDFEDGKARWFLGQLQSASQGVRLASADALAIYSLDWSSTIYWQVRDRLQVMERERPAEVFYLLARDTMDHEVLKALRAKKDFTLRYYRDLQK